MRQYMEEAKYFIQENQPAMQRHLAPMTALLKDLSVMQVTTRTVQVGIRAFCSPMASTDADASAAGAKADYSLFSLPYVPVPPPPPAIVKPP